MNFREWKYMKTSFTGVSHTTLNPRGPGVVRIHLVPPKHPLREPSVAILNGQDIIPVNPSWTVLLNNFINQVNQRPDQPLTQEDLDQIVERTVAETCRIFPRTPRKTIHDDLGVMLRALMDVAYGRKPETEIGYLSLGEYAPSMTAPHRMDLMVSAMTKNSHWHCNQKCLHCYAAGQPEAEVKELTTAEWKRVIDKCRQANIPQLTFTGGEPTMRDDLVELVEYAQWFVTRLNTNGVNLTEDLARALYDASLDSAQITFYSSVETAHNTLVGAQNYRKTLAGLENALKAGLSVSVNTPLCSLNARDYTETLKFLRDLGVGYVSCSSLILTGNAREKDSQATQLTGTQLMDTLSAAAAFCEENEMELSFTSPGWVKEEALQELGLMVPSCGACLSNMAIAPNGDVVPCQSWLSDKPLGNLLTDDWKRIWNHPEAVKIRSFAAKMTHECPLKKEGC
ncbi:MAG: radical SAM protein [Clostridia bacterium]|nr:radical SAM protein [Clostridia bacterium]